MTRIECPAGYRPGSAGVGRLLRLLGTERFRRLQREFGGKRLWIPKLGGRLPCQVCRIRDRCIVAWRSQGHSAANIAGHLKISPKTVYRVLGHSHPRRRSQ